MHSVDARGSGTVLGRRGETVSANLYWRPVDIGKTGVNTSAPSRFMDVLAELTGQRPPLTLGRQHLPGLLALARAERADGWQQLADAIKEHDEIEITAEY